MTNIFYSRARTPFTLTDSDIEALTKTVGQPNQVFFNDEDGSGFQKALDAAIATKSRLCVFRIEHLARASHRAARLRKLIDRKISLYVHSPWPLMDVDLQKVADYTQQTLEAYIKERGPDVQVGMLISQSAGKNVGRPHKCNCGHERKSHKDGPCSECGCQGYEPRE